jgi:hypothetical protein
MNRVAAWPSPSSSVTRVTLQVRNATVPVASGPRTRATMTPLANPAPVVARLAAVDQTALVKNLMGRGVGLDRELPAES